MGCKESNQTKQNNFFSNVGKFSWFEPVVLSFAQGHNTAPRWDQNL